MKTRGKETSEIRDLPRPRRRRPGFGRFNALHVVFAMDGKLATPAGLVIESLAAELELDRSTVWRYLQGLASLRVQIAGFPGGPFRYSKVGFRLFTDEAGKVLG